MFSHGNLERDFTYVEDIIHGLEKIIESPVSNPDFYKIYNIGNSKPINLWISFKLENVTGKMAPETICRNASGDVYSTYLDTTKLQKCSDISPETTIYDGINKFYQWYVEYTKNR